MNLQEKIIRISKLYKKSNKSMRVLVGLIILGTKKDYKKD